MNHKFIISGGGTGGHIFPALAIANEIRKREPGTSILFVGALGRMEMEKVPLAGFPIVGLPVEGLQRKIGFRNIVVLFKLLVSLFKASGIIRSFKPDAVIGVGGYASGPVLRMAGFHGIPCVIQEQNSYAGVTNRLLAKKARKICVAYENMEKYFPPAKIVLTGNPVREEIVSNLTDKQRACSFFNIPFQSPVILVLGGSLGARTINESLLGFVDALEKENITVLWQTGRLYYERIKTELENKKPANVHFFDFISRMDMAYSAADVIISRAGATTISELCITGKPAILVPSPNVAEDHQTKNALALAKNEAAVLVADKDAKSDLVPKTIELLYNDALRLKLAENCRKMALPGATSRITDEIFKCVKEK